MTVADRTGVRKFEQAAASVRSQIADGTLRPGQPAPSGAALSRATGFCELTCRKALRTLIKDGVLVPGPSRNARPRVAGPLTEGRTADAAAFLSAALAATPRGRTHTAWSCRARRLLGHHSRPRGNRATLAVATLLGTRRRGSRC
jgi:DNA-binding GntR family transcriptional regulator